MIKRVLSVALALMLVVACFAGVTVSADGVEFTAKLGYSTTGWDVSEWGENVNTTVTGDGTYTLSWDVAAAAYDAGVFVVDIAGAQAALDATNQTYNVTALTITVDGNDVPVDVSKLITGDIEGNGNYRIEIYNLYGAGTADNPPVDASKLVVNTNLTVTFTLETVEKAAPEGKYELFIAFGGDRAETNDWNCAYYGTATDASAGITATHAKIDVGQTATISLTFDEAPLNAYFWAPCLVGTGIADEIGGIDFTITCKINGEDVAIDMNADTEGKTWWTEGTGDYAASDCIRLAGAYNEWATKYVEKPETITSIEYTVTINAISEPAAPGAEVEYDEEFGLFVAYGGDKVGDTNWLNSYWGDEAAVPEGMTVVNGTIKAGQTTTISVSFAEPTGKTWIVAPCLTGTDITNMSTLDFDVVCKIDGVEVPINYEADSEGRLWWSEGTGSYTGEQCVRMAGAYNEWGQQFITVPDGITSIEYTITLNSAKYTIPEEEAPTIVEIDKNGTYNAYLMLQTPNWTFRNAWDDASYGINGTGWEAISNSWGNYLVHTDAEKAGMTWGNITDTVIAGNGTYSVKITDFGTLFEDDFAAAGQEYFNIIAVSTDLPAGADVTVTDVKLIVDGKERHTYAEAYINTEATSFEILLQNIWNPDVKELNYYPAPAESLEIQFTISGFDYDKVEEAPGTDAEPENPDPEVPATTAPSATEPVDNEGGSNMTGIIIAVVAIAVVAVVVVLVLKKKKA